MKIASISGITYRVQDIERTADFYNKLGFRLGAQDDSSLTVYVNWFWIRFQVAESSRNESMLLNLKVVDVDEFYGGVIEKGLKPVAEPKNQTWGHREFDLKDPDGHTLVFFQKIK
jgi:uncharacterized glyoxalase superfamily protein PhnB